MSPDTILGVFNFSVDDPAWIEQRTKVISAVDAVLATELGGALRFAGVQGSVKPAATAEEIHARIATGAEEVYELTADPRALRVSVLLSLSRAALAVTIRCHGEALAARRETILDDVLAIPLAIRRAGGVAGLRFGYIAPVVREQATYEYPRPRPPRVHEAIEVGAIVDVIDLASPPGADDGEDGAADRMAAAAQGELPPSARREEVDGLVVIRWAEGLDDLAALDRGCAAHEEWLASVALTDIDGNYDERGDVPEPMRGLEDRTGVVKYDPRGKIAYVAVVIFPDGSPEKHHWSVALELVQRRATGDGAPVERVRIIAPLRKLALALAPRAREHGIDAVLYPDDRGQWWNPDPPGSWAYPPR